MVSLSETAYTIILVAVFAGTGASRILEETLYRMSANRLIVIPAYIAILGAGYFLLSLPLHFLGSYTLEHVFSLSKQKIGDWFLDQLKAGVISFIIGLILAGVFYYCLSISPHGWWILVSCFWVFFSVILAKVTPIVIIPLFYKSSKLTDETLRSRIIALAGKMKVKILDVFEIDFSKKTLKANAAFVGVGNTRRVLLADTLKDKYSHDEIEAILAHEFAHYRLKHLLKIVFVNAAATIAIFYFLSVSSNFALSLVGLYALSDLAALPVILLYFLMFGIIMQPLEAYISRGFERHADKMAIETTGNPGAFISMMEKLASQNLSDRSPHPVIKFFFFDHPPVDERVAMAEKYREGERA